MQQVTSQSLATCSLFPFRVTFGEDMQIEAFLAPYEVGPILDRVITGLRAYAVISDGRYTTIAHWGDAPYRQLLAHREALQVYIRLDPVDRTHDVELIRCGAEQGWVIVTMPQVYYDFMRECVVLYSDVRRLRAVSSSLPIFKALRREVSKVATIELQWESDSPSMGLKCSGSAAELHNAGINLVYGRPDDESRFLHPTF